MSEEVNMYFKDPDAQKWLRKLLSEGEIAVSFIKKDGTARAMRATLSETLIPTDKLPKSESKQSDEVLPVFDIDKQEWRSFRFDSVTEINGKLL